jgi:hypothetical protein
MPTFNPNEPVEVTVYRSNVEHARNNALRELRSLRGVLAGIERDLLNGDHPSTSDARRANADAFELGRYVVEVATLIDSRPPILRDKES